MTSAFFKLRIRKIDLTIEFCVREVGTLDKTGTSEVRARNLALQLEIDEDGTCQLEFQTRPEARC